MLFLEKARIEPRPLDPKAECYGHCATRLVKDICKFIINLGPISGQVLKIIMIKAQKVAPVLSKVSQIEIEIY